VGYFFKCRDPNNDQIFPASSGPSGADRVSDPLQRASLGPRTRGLEPRGCPSMLFFESREDPPPPFPQGPPFAAPAGFYPPLGLGIRDRSYRRLTPALSLHNLFPPMPREVWRPLFWLIQSTPFSAQSRSPFSDRPLRRPIPLLLLELKYSPGSYQTCEPCLWTSRQSLSQLSQEVLQVSIPPSPHFPLHDGPGP